ncbi:MAG TPA: amidohydrolase family protein [Candidatus Binataceae bacterium]|nr:amidohydrolase family protein [Candidatus Binataceae bacterium]
MRIDVHAHYFPAPYFDRFHRLGGDTSIILPAMLGGGEAHEIETRFKNMDAAGVEMQVLSVSSMFPFFDRETDAADAARQANDLYAELVTRYPRRFKAFAVIPLPHVEASLKELERALDKLGMIGVTLGASVMNRSTVDEAFEPVYAELNRRGAVIFIHPVGLGVCSPLIRDYGLSWTIGAPFEDTTFVTHVIKRRILERYPKLKIVVPHFGGALPLVLDRIERTMRLFAPDNTETATATVKRMWFDTQVAGRTEILRYAHSVLGVERLVYGSDYPLNRGDAYLRSVAYIREAGLPDGDAEKILDHNAARLLGFES